MKTVTKKLLICIKTLEDHFTKDKLYYMEEGRILTDDKEQKCNMMPWFMEEYFVDFDDTKPPLPKDDVRSYNIGESNYAQHKIQPWDIWLEYKLNPWDADIVKRVLRTKNSDSRKLDYEKIIHICKERIRQIDLENNSEK